VDAGDMVATTKATTSTDTTSTARAMERMDRAMDTTRAMDRAMDMDRTTAMDRATTRATGDMGAAMEEDMEQGMTTVDLDGDQDGVDRAVEVSSKRVVDMVNRRPEVVEVDRVTTRTADRLLSSGRGRKDRMEDRAWSKGSEGDV